MRILVTNDDGIDAPGLQVMLEIAQSLTDDVWVFAPELNQSGASHSLTLHEPIRVNQVDERTFAVRGTPTDCVIMGTRHFLKESPPDLVLSGVNHGSNMAEDITYSGTIAGAIEGALLGFPSIAMSLTCGFDGGATIHWDTPKDHGPRIIEQLTTAQMPEGVLINVNFPDLPPEKVAGTTVTRQGRRDQNLLHVDERFDTWERPYYWFGFERRLSNPAQGTDLWAVYSGQISITPLHADLTHPESAPALAEIFGGPITGLSRKLG